MKLKLKPNIKMAIIINIITIVLFATIVAIGTNQNTKLNATNNNLNSDIEAQKHTIDKLTHDNKILNDNIMNLKNSIMQFESSNNELQEINNKLQDANNKLQKDYVELEKDNELLKSKNQELIEEIKRLEEEISKIKENNNSSSSYKDFKSYMSYKAITDKASKQWKLQQQATTNEDGIRCINGIPMVAVGTGWGLSVGDIALVTCENGNSFKVMIGDTKSDRHTDAEHKTTVDNGCRCEFIVDVRKIDSTAKRLGNMAVLDKYRGYVVNIEKIG